MWKGRIHMCWCNTSIYKSRLVSCMAHSMKELPFNGVAKFYWVPLLDTHIHITTLMQIWWPCASSQYTWRIINTLVTPWRAIAMFVTQEVCYWWKDRLMWPLRQGLFLRVLREYQFISFKFQSCFSIVFQWW
jgi:hypothetical protein